MALKTKALRVTTKTFGGAPLPENTHLLHAADEAMRDYMTAFGEEM
uniref:Uncharacterized protein n=1 Tax=Caulobacter sp. (strain K31) TaxID=366602 RepID=B0SYQ5_CAUSK